MVLHGIMCSNVPPKYKDYLWLKPVNSGFVLYYLWNGAWQPLKLVNNNGTAALADDTLVDAASLKKVISAILGTEEDTNMSLTAIKEAINATREAIRTLITSNSLAGVATTDSAVAVWDPDAVSFEDYSGSDYINGPGTNTGGIQEGGVNTGGGVRPGTGGTTTGDGPTTNPVNP